MHVAFVTNESVNTVPNSSTNAVQFTIEVLELSY